MASRRLSPARLVPVFALCIAAVAGAAQKGLIVAARDEISVSVFNQPTLSGKFLVDADGTFLYPQVGRIQAAGLTPRSIEVELTKQLATIMRNPQVTIVHLPAETKKFTVSGQVQSQGTFTFGGEIRLLEALARAGSIRDDASEQLLIIRPRPEPPGGTKPGSAPLEPETLTVDLYALMDGDMKHNIALEDGDTVLVRRAEPVFVTGYVNSVNAYPVRRGMTVEQAIALAGGISAQGAKNRIEITRTVSGAKKTFKVELGDPVKPGDTIKVGRRIV